MVGIMYDVAKFIYVGRLRRVCFVQRVITSCWVNFKIVFVSYNS